MKIEINEDYVYMGATLECNNGERPTVLLPDASTMTGITDGGLPLIPETASKPGVNILNFGECDRHHEPCVLHIDLHSKWIGATAHATSDNVKVLVKTSVIYCPKNAGCITITDSGQNSSIEDVLYLLNPQNQKQAMKMFLEFDLRMDKEMLMNKTNLKTVEEFDEFIKRKLELVDEWYNVYQKEIQKQIGDFLNNPQSPPPDVLHFYREYAFLSTDVLVAYFSMDDRKEMLNMYNGGISIKDIGEAFDFSKEWLDLFFQGAENFGGFDNMVAETYLMDSVNARQRYDQLGLLLVLPKVANGISDGSGPPNQDVYDHSGTWIGGGDGELNLDGNYSYYNYDKYGNYTGGRTPEQMNDLAKDPAHYGSTRSYDINKGLQERKVGLGSEEAGKVVGPIRRDPSGEAEYIDGNEQKWDVKGFNSNFKPSKGGYTLEKSMRSINKSLSNGENVMLDVTNLNPEHKTELLNEIQNQGLEDYVIVWP